MKKYLLVFTLLSMLFLSACGATTMVEEQKTTQVEIQTNKGTIIVELNESAAPVTVANFLRYVDQGFYAGTIFHRVIPGFMIQGGGFSTSGNQKATQEPIMLESDNGLKNEVGTIAMARTSDPNSATSQFFINVADNDFLNRGARDEGYAVFGKVVEGMDVVKAIEQVQTSSQPEPDWPVEQVVIESITRR